MLGFIIGTISLVALIKVLKGGHYGRGRYGGFGRQWMLRRLFQRLDTTPGQEKVIGQALDEVEKAAMKLREELRAARSEVAKSIRGEHFDASAFRESTAKQEAALEGLRKAIAEGLQAIHEALTPSQREQLADLLEYGPACGGWGHGYGRLGGCDRGRFAHAMNL